MIPTQTNRGRYGLTLLLFLVLGTCTSMILGVNQSGGLQAQDIRVSVIVPNPPPVYWDAYLEFNADVRVMLTNVSQQTHEVKLVPTLTSDRGLSASLMPSYQPLSPLTLPPGETINLTYRELQALFGTPTEADIMLDGINFDRLFASETIPEGNYTLCVEAWDFATNEPLSNNFGCDVFFVQQHEPPLIIWPQNGEEIIALEPQFLNFLWSTTGLPGQTRYRFALYDLDDLGLNNRADAFLLNATRPLFETEELVANTLAYDLALPPLIPGHHYAVQVTAYDPEENLLFAQGGRSAVHQFLYRPSLILVNNDQVVINPGGNGNGGGGVNTGGAGTFQNQTPGNQLAMEACPEQMPANPAPTPTLLSAGQTVNVAGFELTLNSGGNTPLAGTGRILIESLNALVNVSFTGLEVNQNGEVVGNNVDIVATANGNPDLENLSEAAALQLADLVDNDGNWLDTDG